MLNLLKVNLANRIVGLDVMRSIAILVVVFGHYINFFQNSLYINIPSSKITYNQFFEYLVNGFDGVDLFFVLSGFLIGHSLIKTFLERAMTFKYIIGSFWVKRWFRTLPNYFVALLLAFCIYKVIPLHTDNNISFGRYFIFIQNFFKGEMAFFPESWSLSIEEWFYFIFPLVLFILGVFTYKFNLNTGVLFLAIIIYIGSATAFRIHFASTNPFTGFENWNSQIRTSVIMRFDSVVYGVLMALVKITYPELFRRGRYVSLCMGLVILVACFFFAFLNIDKQEAAHFASGSYFSFVGIGMALLLPYFYHMKLKKGFWIRAFTFISVISYSVYLVNYSIIQKPIQILIPGQSLGLSALKCFAACSLTLLLSVLLYIFIETPFMNLRKRILHE